eukprot:IDg16040t1
MYDLTNIFEVFLPQLLTYPNPTDPLNGEAAALQMREPERYQQKVKEYVQKYARPEDFSNDGDDDNGSDNYTFESSESEKEDGGGQRRGAGTSGAQAGSSSTGGGPSAKSQPHTSHMAQPPPNDADVVEMLPAVLRHLSDLRKDPGLAESVFTAVRIQALRQTPVLPAKGRILARVAALAISAPNRIVSEVCAAACACLVSCIARTDSADKAACFIVGLCDALGAIREGVRRGQRNIPIKFLQTFERDYVEEFPVGADASCADTSSAHATSRPRSPPESKIDILPRRAALRATIALLRRSISAPAALAGGDELSAAEQRYARHMWESVNDDVCNVVALASLPSSSPFRCLMRVAISFESHIHAANGQMNPIRSHLVVRLLAILRLIADPRGLCPRLWARVGVAAVMRGSPEVAAASADVVRDGFVANLPAHEIIDTVDPFLET